MRRLFALAIFMALLGCGNGDTGGSAGGDTEIPDASARSDVGLPGPDYGEMTLEEAVDAGAALLWIAAHPDDEALSGPALYKACHALGSRCRFLVLTRGEGGNCYLDEPCLPDLATVRSAEMAAAAECYGAELELLDYPNLPTVDPPYTPENTLPEWQGHGDPVRDIAHSIREHRPDIVITFHPAHGFSGHPEHRLTGALVGDAIALAAEPQLDLDGFPPHRPATLYRTVNRVPDLESIWGLGPNVVNDWFDATQACGDEPCADGVVRCFTHHQSQMNIFGRLLRATVPTIETMHYERIPLPDERPLDHVLRLNHIQVKGTHNSFHLPPDELVVPNWDYTHAPLDVQLEEQDVRQVEIDVHWHPEDEGFRVYHVAILDDRSTCDTFLECLGILKAWSDGHPEHAPLFILVEPKDDVDPHPITGHYDALDAEILAVWPTERLITPDDVRGNHPDLRTALAADGWPLLGECRGKALFQMLDSGDHRAAYLATDPTLAGRPMFVRGGPEEPWGSIVEIGNAIGREDEIRGLVEQGYLVRSTADSTDPESADQNPARSQAALDAGSHLISTDFPAPVEGGYWFELPGGGPLRCNPVSAPAECTGDPLE